MSEAPIDPNAASLNRRAQLRRETDRRLTPVSNILAQIPEAVLCVDRDWVITYANSEAARISRVRPEDIGTRTHWELFPETIGTDLESAYRKAMSGVAQRVEYFYEPFDTWVSVHALPTEDGLALYYRDISDDKRAEARGRAAIRQLQQVFDASIDSIVCIDRNWICTFANRAALRILKADNLIGENLWERYPSNQQEPFRSNYLMTMEKRVPTEFEAYYPEPLDVWFKVLASPFEEGIVIFATDITDRKEAELLRDTSARQLRQVLETTTDAVAILDRDWSFSFLNRRAKELLSPQGDLLGKNMWQEFPTATQTDSLLYHYHRAMDQRIPGEFEVFYPEPLNLWLAIQCRPFENGIVIFFRDITEERRAKQILLDQQATLSFVQQTARVATWEIDLASAAMSFSSGSYAVFGRPCSEITTVAGFREHVVPEYVEILQKGLRHAVETGEVSTVDYQVMAPDGGLLWMEGRGLPVYNEQGVATHFRGMTTDISARKRNEEALIASEARYRVLADLNPQAIWMGAPDGSITYANQGFLDYLGLTAETLGGKGWLDAVPPEDRLRVHASWSCSVATGAEYDIEARMIRARDGRTRWWWLRAQTVRDDSGRILHWLGVAIDIDDRKTFADTLQQRQEETERQRAELETIYQTAPVGLALYDPVEFRYLRINDREAEIVGLPKEEILGQVITNVVPIAGVRELLEMAAAGHAVRNHMVEGELPTRPGEHRFWNVSYSPVMGADGRVEAITAVILETTNQKKAEAALIQSEKLAAVGRLASSISHEINNPLEAITNLLYLITLSEELPESIRSLVETAQSELSRVCQIATQTLRFHRQAVRATNVSAADLVNAVLHLYQGRLANSNIRVEATYSVSTKVLCFENDIRQVLNNLIANAIDAMRRGGRLVVRAHDATLFTSEHPGGRRGVRIVIADIGHGMPAAVQARLFEPFYTTKELNGTGLGLWISAGIIERHQGRLGFRSSQHPVHHGTVFSLFLPSATDSQVDAK